MNREPEQKHLKRVAENWDTLWANLRNPRRKGRFKEFGIRLYGKIQNILGYYSLCSLIFKILTEEVHELKHKKILEAGSGEGMISLQLAI